MVSSALTLTVPVKSELLNICHAIVTTLINTHSFSISCWPPFTVNAGGSFSPRLTYLPSTQIDRGLSGESH
jgi:hypothetical protein